MRHGLFYKRVFKPAVTRALPPDKQALRWHDLRHTCASLSLAVSPNLATVMHRLGHGSIAITLADGLSALFTAPAPNNVAPLRTIQTV
jgi:integrase